MGLRGLLGSIILLAVLGIGGVIYRIEMARPMGGACALDAKVCPDGTSVARIAPSCAFPACAPPNISIESAGIEFALPEGYLADGRMAVGDPAVVGAYTKESGSDYGPTIVIRVYPIGASSTPIETIRATAIQDGSGLPAPATAFSATTIGTHRFTKVQIGRFEGVVDTAYYLSRETDVLRFDAIDHGVTNWTDPSLDVLTLTAAQDLKKLLQTLQGG